MRKFTIGLILSVMLVLSAGCASTAGLDPETSSLLADRARDRALYGYSSFGRSRYGRSRFRSSDLYYDRGFRGYSRFGRYRSYSTFGRSRGFRRGFRRY